MESKYNSRVNTFYASDLWNLTMGTIASPPADFTLPSADFAVSYFFYRFGSQLTAGFESTDQPRYKSIGFFSNLADCLVDQSARHSTAGGMSGAFQLERFGSPITGTIVQTPAGDPTITGTGTFFTQELSVGQDFFWCDDGGVTRCGRVSAIASNTSMTIVNNPDVAGGSGNALSSTGMFTNTTAAKKLHPKIVNAGTDIRFQFPTMNVLYPWNIFCGNVSKVLYPQGMISIAAGSATMTGIGTKFLSELTAGGAGTGQYVAFLDDAGLRYTRRVDSIANDGSLTLNAAVATVVTRKTLNKVAGDADYDQFLQLRGSVPLVQTWSTIQVETAFALKRLWFGFVAEIETNMESDAVIAR